MLPGSLQGLTRVARPVGQRGLLGEVLANMSHEIRTLTTAILGLADSLVDPRASKADKFYAAHAIRQKPSVLPAPWPGP